MAGRPASQRAVITVGDGTGELDLVFFGRPQHVARRAAAASARRGLFSGKVGTFNGRRQLVHPEYVLLHGDALADARGRRLRRARCIPVYPATKDIRSWTIANAVERILDMLDPLPDPLPAEIRARHGLLDLDTALRADPPARRPRATGTRRGTG